MTSVKDKTVFKTSKAKAIFLKTVLISSLSIAGALAHLGSASGQEISTGSEFEDLKIAQVNSFVAQRNFTLGSIWRYAAAVQEINPIREEHNRQINSLLGAERPSKVCYHQPIPTEVKQNCQLFGSKMFQILRKHEVHDIYTPISIQVQSDENLRKKIQKAGICQQRGLSLNDCF